MVVAVVAYAVVLACVVLAIFQRSTRVPFRILIPIILIVFLVAFLVADLRLGAGKSVPQPIGWITNLPVQMMFLSPDGSKGAAYRETIRTLLAVLLAVITLWFAAILPWLVISKLKRDIRDQQIVDIHKVGEIGSEDIDTMYRYYKPGNDITVFSGDFDWLVKQSPLRELIRDLANKKKIRLVSYKKPSEIVNAWAQATGSAGISNLESKRILSELKSCFRFHQRPFKFTLIKYSEHSGSFLSLVPGGPSGNNVNIGVESSKNPEAGALYYMVKKLCEAACEELKTWEEAEAAEKAGTEA